MLHCLSFRGLSADPAGQTPHSLSKGWFPRDKYCLWGLSADPDTQASTFVVWRPISSRRTFQPLSCQLISVALSCLLDDTPGTKSYNLKFLLIVHIVEALLTVPLSFFTNCQASNNSKCRQIVYLSMTGICSYQYHIHFALT